MSRRSLFLLLRFLLLPAALWPPSSSAFHSPQVDIQSQLAMADELPREEIALLYQRLSLKSGEAAGSGRTIGRGTGGKNGTKMGTTAHQGRRKIAPPVVIAVFSSSASAPTSRRPTSSSSPSMAPATTGIPSPSPNQSSGAGASSAGGKDSLWPPSFLQVSRVTAIVLVGVFFSVATVVGNALVMLSICVDRKLQTISNFFLFSLAVADLTIGLISIPLMTLYTANESWSFGYNLCQFWLCLDYLMCNASVLNLLLISFDRYFSVTLPLTYRPKRTTRKALMWIAGAYLISLILWPPLIIFWPLMEGRFVVEESHFCVVQFLALGDARDWLKQLATVVTASLAFYIPVTIMIVLYYRVYLETRRRQKELRKLQDGQQIRGLQHSAGDQPFERSIRTISSVQSSQAPTKSGRINFMDFVGNISTLPTPSNFKKKERFSLLKYCTGKAQTDISSEDSVDDGGGLEETCGLTTSNLDSILADNTVLAVELAKEGEVAKEEGAAPSESGKCPADLIYFNKEGSAPLSICTALELGRTSRPASVHTYNSIVIIEYPDGGRDSQRPSVRLSSQAEVESLSARNSVERRLEPVEELTKAAVKDEKDADAVNQADSGGSERQQLRLTKSCPSGPPAQLTTAGRSQQQQNGLMKKSEIQLLREEQMRRSEKERRRNERKQESKAAKTLSAILFAFIITWTPYNVIVCLEAFYPNSVPASLFTLSYFLSYINSTINPLCYALCNARFRMTYLKILKCKWGRRNSGGSPFDGAFAHHHHHQQKQGGSGQRTLLKGRHRSRTSTTIAQ